VCTGELCAVRDDLASFQSETEQVLTISVDSVFSHKVFAEQQGYEFPLLSDFWPHGEVAQQYGVFNDERGIAVRGTFIVDKDGKVAWKVVNNIPDARDQGEYKQALASLA
jgi:peroxiredoxin